MLQSFYKYEIVLFRKILTCLFYYVKRNEEKEEKEKQNKQEDRRHRGQIRRRRV